MHIDTQLEKLTVKYGENLEKIDYKTLTRLQGVLSLFRVFSASREAGEAYDLSWDNVFYYLEFQESLTDEYPDIYSDFSEFCIGLNANSSDNDADKWGKEATYGGVLKKFEGYIFKQIYQNFKTANEAEIVAV